MYIFGTRYVRQGRGSGCEGFDTVPPVVSGLRRLVWSVRRGNVLFSYGVIGRRPFINYEIVLIRRNSNETQHFI